jgi:hypothetical protein
MVETCKKHWPAEIPLKLYAQDFTADLGPRVEVIDLYQAAPWLKPWRDKRSKMQRGKIGKGEYSFRHDAYRFAPKVAALAAAVATADADILLWLDADIVTHADVTIDWLDELFPSPEPMAWLSREGKNRYPETSFLMFRLSDYRISLILECMVELYRAEALFELKEWHDAFALEFVVAELGIQPLSLSGEGAKFNAAFTNSVLAEKMDHLKGMRKALGRTPREHRKVGGGGEYWQL